MAPFLEVMKDRIVEGIIFKKNIFKFLKFSALALNTKPYKDWFFFKKKMAKQH